MSETGNGGAAGTGDGSASGRRFGTYELGEELGRGAMARVYRATRLGSGEEVAVKVLDSALADDREVVGRFRHEARAGARLEHPGIVRVYEEGEAAGTYYFAMQLVSGESLADLLLDRGRLPPERVVSLAVDAARALAYAHRAGVTHRDIKPANLLIGRDGHCRITDFGAALAAAQTRLTRTGESLGSPHYIAPEVIRGHEADGRADLYGLGIVLFEALTGERPYSGRGFLDIMQRHLDPKLPRVRELEPTLPEALDRIVARLMAKSRGERYQSADELLEDLAALDLGKSERPRPAASTLPAASDMQKLTARNPVVVRVAVGVVLVGLAVAGGSYLVATRPWGVSRVAPEGRISPPPPATVSVAVAASPSPCRVKVDGRDLGYLPLELDLAVGTHRFDFEWEELGVTRSIEQEVTAETRRVYAAAEPE